MTSMNNTQTPGVSSVPPISKDAFDELQEAFNPARVQRSVELAPYTTFRLGGPADVFVEAKTDDELASAIQIAR